MGWLTLDMLCQKDSPGAGSPRRMRGGIFSQRLFETGRQSQFAKSRAFAARDNQPIQAVKMFWLPHFDRFNTNSAKHLDVFGKIALERQNAASRGSLGHRS